MPEKKKAVSKEKAGKEKLIYLGPGIPGVISAGTILSNGLTPQMEKAAKELPALHRLLVPVMDVVKAKKELNNEVSAISVCYKKAAEYAAQKGCVYEGI